MSRLDRARLERIPEWSFLLDRIEQEARDYLEQAANGVDLPRVRYLLGFRNGLLRVQEIVDELFQGGEDG